MKLLWTLSIYFSLLSCSDQSNLENRLTQIQETQIDNIQYLMNKHRVDSIKAIFVKGSVNNLTKNQVAEFYYTQGDSIGVLDNTMPYYRNRVNVYDNGILVNQIFDMFTKLSYHHINKKDEVIMLEEKLSFKNLITFDTSYFYFENDRLIKSELRKDIISTYFYNDKGLLEFRKDSLIFNVLQENISTELQYNSYKLISSVKSQGDYQTHVIYDSLGFPVEKYFFSDLDTLYYLRYSIFK